MKVTFTNVGGLNALVALQSVSETGRLGFAIAKNRRKLLDELKEYIETRDGILQQYGFRDDAGNLRLPDDRGKELAELDGIEFDMDVTTVDDETFYSGSLTSGDMFALDWMIEEQKDE